MGDYGAYIIYGLPNGNVALDTLIADIDEEVEKLQTTLMSEKEFTKLQNQFENDFLDKNTRMLGIAENLADGYTFYNNTNNINTELEQIRKITRQEVQDVARKYLNKNQRVVLYYLPKKG